MEKHTKYINPFVDFAFKRIFGTEPNKDLLIEFLNAIFNGRKTIVDLMYSKTEYLGDNTEEAKTLFDLLCTGENGEKFLIEVQHSSPVNFKKRSIYYTSRLISEQAPKGEMRQWKYNISEVYFIAIIDAAEPKSTPDKILNDSRYLHDICLCYRETGEIFYEHLGYTYIDFSNFVKTEAECNGELDKWLFNLKHLEEMDHLPPHLRKTIFEKLYKVAEYAKLTKEEQKMYDQDLKRKWDNAAVLAQAEETGEARGIAKGKLEGKREEKLELARVFKKKGIALDLIAEGTGLSIQEIEKL